MKEALKRKTSLVITNKINRKLILSKQIKVDHTLNFLTKCASDYRNVVKSHIIGITGSCGKTTLKELLGKSLGKISKLIFLQNHLITNLEFH